MDEHEYAANMDLGRVFLEIMGRVVDEGFGFIAPELERWQDIEQIVLFRSAENQQGELNNLQMEFERLYSYDLFFSSSLHKQSLLESAKMMWSSKWWTVVILMPFPWQRG